MKGKQKKKKKHTYGPNELKQLIWACCHIQSSNHHTWSWSPCCLTGHNLNSASFKITVYVKI